MTLRTRPVLWCFLAAFLLYVSFLWPLPRHIDEGIPYGLHTPAEAAPRTLVQGDHLQLLYHFDMLYGFLKGDSPWFRNLWEFNRRDEDIPRRTEPYYAPFALPYAGFRALGATDALAWNLSQFLSVFLGLFFCFHLARRMPPRRLSLPAALAVAILATAVPYRWVTLAGGSPTGFGMGLVPGVALGVDMAVRDRRLRGGFLAGICLLFCYAADLHCFLFSALALPFWGIIALLRTPQNPFTSRKRFGTLVCAVLPIAIAGVLSLAIAAAVKKSYGATDVSGGRTLDEIRILSPDWHAFFDPSFFCHLPDQFHMGYAYALLFLLAGLSLAVLLFLQLRSLRRKTPHPAAPQNTLLPVLPLLSGILLGAAILASIALALGTNGPCDALPLRALRKLIPPFRMVRQPIKVYCLMPALCTAFFSLAFAAASGGLHFAHRRLKKAGLALLLLLALSALIEMLRPMHAGICILPGENHRYRDAVRKNSGERALVLPIWPGDSAWSSLYQYAAIRSRLRMLNGYAAVKTSDYLENVFLRYETMTEGDLSEDRFAALRALPAHVILLHENAFPEKVSPFAFGVTLRAFLAHPSLTLLSPESHQGVWGFELAAEQPAGKPVPEKIYCAPGFYAPTRVRRYEPASASAGFRLRDRSARNPEDFGWLVRAEKSKPLSLRTWAVAEDGSEIEKRYRFPAEDTSGNNSAFRLLYIPVHPSGKDFLSYLNALPPSGDTAAARISDIAFVHKSWDTLPRTEEGNLRLSAPDFIHEFGTTLLDEKQQPFALSFTPSFDPASRAAHGPCLPLGKEFCRGRARLVTLPENSSALTLKLGDRTASGAEFLPYELDSTGFADFEIHYSGKEPVTFLYLELLP